MNQAHCTLIGVYIKAFLSPSSRVFDMTKALSTSVGSVLSIQWNCF